ncbi:MAG TPA: cell division protein FtsL [Chitinispirillaceae bacterium]|nr:cell division protein FtsL [Chitinispirillaceae bacterium]
MKKREKKSQNGPLLRVRPMLLWITLILLMISGPLLLVWKQVYISSASLEMDAKRKSLIAFQKEIATLRLSSNRLSATERIERIARDNLGLEYPATSQIYVIHIPREQKSYVFSKTQDIVAFFRKVISGERS